MSRVWFPYAQLKTMPDPMVVERTEGTRLYLDDGRVLIDGISSWWTAAHGYNHPYILEAMRRFLDLEQISYVQAGDFAKAAEMAEAEAPAEEAAVR